MEITETLSVHLMSDEYEASDVYLCITVRVYCAYDTLEAEPVNCRVVGGTQDLIMTRPKEPDMMWKMVEQIVASEFDDNRLDDLIMEEPAFETLKTARLDEMRLEREWHRSRVL